MKRKRYRRPYQLIIVLDAADRRRLEAVIRRNRLSRAESVRRMIRAEAANLSSSSAA